MLGTIISIEPQILPADHYYIRSGIGAGGWALVRLDTGTVVKAECGQNQMHYKPGTRVIVRPFGCGFSL